MDGAALTLLFAAVGFGWQPMPDGSPRYEYIVQVDADLAATMAAGQSIPLVGEVPEDIHPIGRVRVVIGEGDLPRERLVTRLKPPVEEQTIVRGQNVGGQYAYNPPSSAAQALNSAATAWNGGEAAPATAPAPSGQALFDSAAQAWNQNVAAPATNAFNNAGQNLGAAVAAPVQAGVDNAANQLRQAYGNVSEQAQASAAQLGDRTRGLLDEVTRPLTQQPALTARDVRNQPQQTQPLQQQPAYTTTPGTVAGATAAPMQSWNQANTPPSTDPLRPGVAAAQPTGVQNWNDPNAGNTAVAPPVTQPQFYNPPQNNNFATTPQQPAMGQPQAMQQPLAQGESAWNTVGAPGVSGSSPQNMAGAPPAGSNPSADDPWKYAADPRTGVPQSSVAADANSTAPFRGAGSTWPSDVAPPTSAPLNTGGLTSSPPNVATPAITKNSFGEPADRPLDATLAGAGGLPATGISTGTAPAPAITKSDIFPGGFPSNQNAKPASTTLAGIGQQPPAMTPAQNTTPAAASAGSRDNGVIALVAWVMLFGSAFGNLYLFWSYLDVRQKYRSLVRKTARAVGSRFSAA